MKVIISHDVDHLKVWEHLAKDLILPKFLVRMHLELMMGKIRFREYGERFRDIAMNKWQNIEQVINFDESKEVRSTFFIGVSQGKGLSYHHEEAGKWIAYIESRGFEVGVHGIAFDDPEAIQEEHDLFKNYSRFPKFGIRMHYLRKAPRMLEYLAEAGYLYDASSTHGQIYRFAKNDMWIFPLDIMDGWVINDTKRYQCRDINMARHVTMQMLDRAERGNVEYLSILFHDRYFSPSFQTWKDWYIWLIEFLTNRGATFISYRDAVAELSKQGV